MEGPEHSSAPSPRQPRRRALLAGLVLAPLAIGAVAFYAYFRPFQPATMTVAPAEISLEPTRSQRFVVRVVDSLGNVLSMRPGWSATGGETDDGGQFTAGPRTGRYQVRATLGELTAVAAVTIIPGPPASVDVSPAAIGVDVSGEVQFLAFVRDHWGNALDAPSISWTVTPPSIGTIGPGGLFVASPTSGSGKISATSGSVTTDASITVRCPTRPTVGGLAFNVTCTDSSDVYVQATVTGSASSTIPRLVDPDVAQIEREFGREFRQRPLIYVFGSTRSYADGLSAIFRYGREDAERTATRTDAAFPLDPGYSIVVNWESVGQHATITAVRHELTHMMVYEIVGWGTAEVVPTWLNEGLATLQEFTIPGTRWDETLHRHASASMSAQNALPTLDQLTPLSAWRDADGDTARYQYFVASQAVRLLSEDIGMPGILRLISAIADGTSFFDAYRSIAGKSFDEFASAFPARVRALAPGYPGIATAPDTGAGPGLSIIAYGFPPATTLTISVTSASVFGGAQRGTDSYGVALLNLDASWPSGTYTITARGGGRTATTTARK